MIITAAKVFDHQQATWYRDGLVWKSILIIFGYDCCHVHTLPEETAGTAEITLPNGTIIKPAGEMELPVSVGNALEQQLFALTALHTQLEATKSIITKQVMSSGLETGIQRINHDQTK